MRETFLEYLGEAVGATLLLAVSVCLVGCQGLSSPGQQQAGTLSFKNTGLIFGNIAAGSSKTLSVTATNSGTVPITISGAAISTRYFSLTAPSLPMTVSAGQSTAISIKFAPDAAGVFNAVLVITSTAANPATNLPLSGTATSPGQLTVNRASEDFGKVMVGTSGTGSGSLSASGADVTITAAITNNSAFTVGNLSLPVTIAAGQSAPFTVTFSPQTPGAASATLTFTSDAQPATAKQALTGTGTPAPTHAVTLSWRPSASQNISGYNIYRAVYVKSCGTFSKINSVLNTSTLYTDLTVVDGTSYCYATTAVNSRHEESPYSNVISNLKIPPP